MGSLEDDWHRIYGIYSRLIFGMPRSWWTIQLLREKFTVGQYEDFHHFSPHNAGTRSMTWRYLGSGDLQWAHVALGSAIPTGIRIPGIPLVRIWVPSSHRVRSMGPVRGIITLAGKSPILMELKLVFGRQAVPFIASGLANTGFMTIRQCEMAAWISVWNGDGVIPMPSDKITMKSPIFNIHFWLSTSKIILYDQRIYCEYLWGQGISVFCAVQKAGKPSTEHRAKLGAFP